MHDIETSRLRFHRHTRDDFAEAAAMWADPETTRHIGGSPSTDEESWARLLRNAGHWALEGYGFWVVRERDTGRFAGEVGLKAWRRGIGGVADDMPEIGWVLAPWAQGRGMATEAAAAALAWGEARFAWPRTVCLIEPANAASLRVAAKLGYGACVEAVYHGKAVTVLERWKGLA